MSIIQGTAHSGGQYQIERSLRFNSADSAYLSRTPGGAGSLTTWTWSGWVKRGAIGGAAFQHLFSAGTVGAFYLAFQTDDTLKIRGSTIEYVTTAKYRDPSAHMHVLLAWDTTNGTAGDRARLYVNGVEVTSFSTETHAGASENSEWNKAVAHNIGRYAFTGTQHLNGYLTEVNFIDGQALTPSDFGETDPNTGVWRPKKYTGTYGTNGFYLNFSDNSGTTATTLGKDSSGNGNNWTPNNFSVTAGAGNDSLVDTPTPYGSDTGAGGEVRGNYATLNPLRPTASGSFVNGNLDGVNETSTPSRGLCSTIALPWSGKWYAEVTFTSSIYNWCGITANAFLAADINTAGQQSVLYYANNGNKYVNGSATAYGASYTTETIGIAFDGPNTQITFYKAGVSQGAITLPSSTVDYVFCQGNAAGVGTTGSWNFGQRPFAYTAPSGFKALCTQNLPTPTIGATSTTQANDYFNAVLYTGNNSTNTITGLDFQPDMVWIKGRSQSSNNVLQDAVRGSTKYLISNSTGAEGTDGSVTSFNSNGFTLTTDAGVSFNANGTTYVAWNWKANGAGSSNTSGTITSTVSANTTSGFSIVTYTGTGANATVGHGLGATPKMIIVKSRDQGTTGYTGNWYVYHASNTSAPETDYLLLNTTAATADDTFWNDTAPTSTVFSVGALSGTNDSGDKFVAYCWAEVEGFSKAFSYASNNTSDNAFVYLGFRPRWFMIKSASAGGTNLDWVIYDTARMTYNYIANTELRANLATAEGGLARNPAIDILSNGFKVRSSAGEIGSSTLYVGMAFAETPFKYSLAR